MPMTLQEVQQHVAQNRNTLYGGAASDEDAFKQALQNLQNNGYISAAEGNQYLSQAQPTSGGGFSSLVPSTPTTDVPPFTQAQTPTVTGGNYNQVQNATQGGQFATVGSTATDQQQTTGGTTNQNATGTTAQNTVGTTNQNTNQTNATNNVENINQRTQGTTDSTTQGTTTNNAIDTLGFGALLKGQADQVGASDTARNAWLQDVMNTGGSGFQSQIDQGIRNSLSGPQMSGAGDSARARASGYAAAEVGRKNMDQRLNASGQLAGPTGLSTLSKAADPYIGSTSSTNSNTKALTDALTTGQNTSSGLSTLIGNTSGTNTQNSTGSSNQNTSGSTTGFSNLTGTTNEAQAGSTTGQSSQAGAGQIPQGQPVKTGGCVLCTAAIELKLSKHHRVLRKVIRHKLVTDNKRFNSAARGYFHVFTPFAAWLLTQPRLARILWPMAKAVVYEELRVAGRKLPFKLWPWLVHWIGHTFCVTVDNLIPTKGYVDNPRIVDIARRNNILFEVLS